MINAIQQIHVHQAYFSQCHYNDQLILRKSLFPVLKMGLLQPSCVHMCSHIVSVYTKQGEVGAAGSTGPSGAQGGRGEPGPNGAVGPAGPTVSIVFCLFLQDYNVNILGNSVIDNMFCFFLSTG